MSLYWLDNKTDYDLRCIDKRVVLTTGGIYNVTTDYFDNFMKFRVMFSIYVWRHNTILPYTPCNISNIKLFESDNQLFLTENEVPNDLIIGTIPSSIDFSATTSDDLTTLFYSFGIEGTKRYIRLKYDLNATVDNEQSQQNPIIINFLSISEKVIS